jgi:hypothetical protein
MNENVNVPIFTKKEGEKITKVCVESMHKVINRLQDKMHKAWNDSVDVFDSLDDKTVKLGDDEYQGSIIVGTGVSQPCNGDQFDEELGNEIAFKKAKLNANIKKYNFLWKVFKIQSAFMEEIHQELDKVDDHIYKDIYALREHNESYLIHEY